jgi:hypothetical protein
VGTLGAHGVLGRERVPVERAVLDVVAELGRVEDVLVGVTAALKGVDASDAVGA